MADPAVRDPRLLINTSRAARSAPPEAAGAVWRLTVEQRDLDANVIALPAGERIERHFGPDLDVVLHVIRGSGQLIMEAGVLQLQPGDLVWLPRRSERQITAGSDGLHYLTVHRRRQSLGLEPPGPAPAG